MEDEIWTFPRLLQDNGTESSSGDNGTETSDDVPPTNPNDGPVLVNTVAIYGTLFVIIWLLFCWLRLESPRTYNVRSWAKDIRCKLAQNQYGFFSWIWEVYDIPEKQFMDQCGMDSLCFVRILRWAFKVAAVAAFNALWLIPVYGSSESSEETDYITDYIASITVSHVPPESPRLIATTIGAYVVFGAALYFLYQEIEWFQRFRHRFLYQPRSRNYTVYVHGIPEEYKADYDLADFFQVSFGLGRVQEAHVRLNTPQVLKLTNQRDVLVQKLEHAINVLNVKEIRPTHMVNRMEVDSIETFSDELKDINRQITERIEFLEGGGYDSETTRGLPMDGEGKPLDGGFVTFYNLSSKQAAIQMNHARNPFEMQVLEAPDPDGRQTADRFRACDIHPFLSPDNSYTFTLSPTLFKTFCGQMSERATKKSK